MIKKIIPVLFLLLFVAGCGAPPSKPYSQMSEQEKKVYREQQSEERKKIAQQFSVDMMSKIYGKGETAPVELQMREYEKGSMEPKSVMMGKASYKLLETAVFDRLSVMDDAIAGKKYFVAYIEVTGDAGNKGMPINFAITGTDPAPILYAGDEETKTKYHGGTTAGMSACRQKNTRKDANGFTIEDYKSLMSIDTNVTTPQKSCVAFVVPSEVEPDYLVLMLNKEGGKDEYVGIKLR